MLPSLSRVMPHGLLNSPSPLPFLPHWVKNGSGEGEFNKPWGITLDNEGNIYVADWKNHRVQKLSPRGEFIMSIGKYGTLPVPENAFAVTYLGPFISHTDPPGYPKARILNHPTDVAVDPDGDIYVA